MTTKYSTLILTDHSSHSPLDSIYSLSHAISENVCAKSTIIASRGLSKNTNFFSAADGSLLWGRAIDDNFVYANHETWYEVNSQIKVSSFDVIFLRIDHPVPQSFLVWLKKQAPQTIFINDPSGLIETASKEYLLNFSDISPWIRIANSQDDILAMSHARPIVIKPFFGYGGQGILKISNESYWSGNEPISQSTFEVIINKEIEKSGQILITEYLPNVTQGDKRILVVAGNVVGAFLRLPAVNSWICNLHQGGTVKEEALTKEENEMVNILSNNLLKKGIVIFGFDTLMGKDKRLLSEINTTNVGGFIQAEQATNGKNITEVANIIWDYIAQLS